MRIELSRMSVVVWGVISFLIAAWIFALGLCVGKGMLPDGVESVIQASLHKLKEVLAETGLSRPDPPLPGTEDPKLSFYRNLASKKDEAALKDKAVAAAPKENAPDKEVRAPAVQQPPQGASGYTVQLASLDQEERATAMVNRLNQRGYQAYYYRVEIGGRPYFRVRCGSFAMPSDAANLRDQLAREEKLNGFVIHTER